MATQWSALKHKTSPEQQEKNKQKALADYSAARSGMARLRLYRNETQLKLAGRMNVPQSVVSRWERGNNPQLRTIQRFVESLGGRLEMQAVFPNDDVVDLNQLFQETPAEEVKRPEIQLTRAKKSVRRPKASSTVARSIEALAAAKVG